MTLDRRLLLLLYPPLLLLRSIKNRNWTIKAGNLKIVKIFNAEKKTAEKILGFRRCA